MATEREPSADLERLLEYVKSERGFDFTGYKRPSLARRVTRRLEAAGCPDYGTYLDYLQVHPGEFGLLFNTILINVTGFFRDADAWACIDREILPKLLGAKTGGEPIRVWSAGCASGEEAYTAAMLLVEHLGEEQYLERVKIYATDVDDLALDEARAATFPAEALEAVPEHLAARCFETVDGRRVFRRDLRRGVIFGRNDLVQDAPISRVDLLICRNTLMYFNAESQARILGRFQFALQSSGYLFMGKSEMLITHGDMFTPVDLKRRIFAKRERPSLSDGLTRSAAFKAVPGESNGDSNGSEPAGLRELVLEAAPIAQIAVDAELCLTLVNERARKLMGIGAADVGRALKDLAISYRPFELRPAVEQALARREPHKLEAREVTTPAGELRLVEVDIGPLVDGEQVHGATILFTDVTSRRKLQEELEASRSELETSYEELQSTVEELETTNEELQSTNEELETTNEELQSTNEELETMNEELQSTNEELETTNDELRVRSLELNEVNSFLETILTSLGTSVVVVDRELRVEVWNAHSEEMWGLRAEETIGEHLLNLDFGLPLDVVKPALRACLAGETEPEELSVQAVNRRGRAFPCVVTLVTMRSSADEITGAILLIRDARQRNGDEGTGPS